MPVIVRPVPNSEMSKCKKCLRIKEIQYSLLNFIYVFQMGTNFNEKENFNTQK